MTIDTSVFGPSAALADLYLAKVNEVNELDARMGNREGSFFGTLKDNNSAAVEEAESIIKQIEEISDATYRTVVAYVISRDRRLSNLVNKFAEEHAPKVEAPKFSAEDLAAMHSARQEAQGVAEHMFKSLEALHKDSDALAQLPELPKKLRGGAPGKRAPVGRRLPKNITWVINDEEHTGKTTLDAAKLIGLKSAGELRLALQNSYPEALPNPFSVTINNKTVAGRWVEDANTADEDDDDTDADTEQPVEDFA